MKEVKNTHLENIQVNTAVARARCITENIARNVGGVWAYPTLSGERPWAGETVVIAAAGPSLDKNLHLLRERDCVLLALNTSLGALRKHGVKADACVCVENIDLTRYIAPYSDTFEWLYIPLSSHPALWKLWPDRTAWFGHVTFEEAGLHDVLGTTPIQCSGNVGSAAVALAMELGAARVVLIGQDLAYGSDGQCYAKGTEWDSFRAKFLSDARLEYESPRFEERHELHRSGGAKGYPKEQDVVELDGWGGGKVKSTWLWVQQREWLEEQPRCVETVDFVNATEGGARIEGWREVSLFEILSKKTPTSRRPWIPGRHVTRERARQAKAVLRDQACDLQLAARAVLQCSPELDDAMPAFTRGYHLVRSAAIGEILEKQLAGMRSRDLVRYSWEAYIRGADAILKALDE